MSKIEMLADMYAEHVSAPWPRTVSGAERVVMVVYPKELERTLRNRIDVFAQATHTAGHGWRLIDCTDWFATWMAANDYSEAYFEHPSDLQMPLEGEFRPVIESRLAAEIESADEGAVVALLGVGSLYGFTRISELVSAIEQSIQGRLLVFFPGTKTENNYRLLDARDGWNYLAHCIALPGEGGG